MLQRISFITIGVHDLEAMRSFYTHVFGWQPMKVNDGIVFFRMNGFILGLYPFPDLADDIGIKHPAKADSAPRFTLAVNFNSEKEVDDIFKKVTEKGVTVVKAPEKVFWGGYRGYIADIENNYWELAYNPFIEMDVDGNIIRHK